MKKKGIGSEASAERMSKGDANLQLLNPAEQEKHLQKQKRRRLQGREDEVVIFFCLFVISTFLSHAKMFMPIHIIIFQLASHLLLSFYVL